MDPEHRAVLRAHRLYLSGQLLVSDSIVPFLYQEEILTEAQMEDILSQPTDSRRTLKLLDLLPSRGPRAFPVFLRALEDFSWVREKLLLELQTETGKSPGARSTDKYQLPASVLQKVPSDRDLSRLASRLGPEWEAVVMDLGLTAEDVFRCRSDHALSTQAAVLSALILWKRREGRRATVQRLLQSLDAAEIHPSVLEDALK
ncbi:death domain-containing protein CRADD isoform X2 [Cheilinus undulatus]|uniref:death domain-containing protein CRADD isoform X2 n=1 Tax=Cheilinus undulatus TaxID=241271 RepID=UPI001BD2F9FF|nr:death domain-containing protein CRADD isoform X2 [Cheilinus undulatus]